MIGDTTLDLSLFPTWPQLVSYLAPACFLLGPNG